MIRAILFDFNGVIVDDEPVHFKLFQRVLEESGIPLQKKDYYSKYLGMDDYDCFTHAAKDEGKAVSKSELDSWIEKKSKYYDQEMRDNTPFVPGALDFIRNLAAKHYLGIVSGALRQEIEMILERGKVREFFNAIVAAEDIEKGKPDPEGYDKGLRLLNRDSVASADLLFPAECLVFEDSIWGIQAASAAGMPSVALTTSFAPSALPGAKLYLKDFQGLDADELLQKVG